ncbi:hypothetical protein H0H92_016122 [Tricholoma furcatifolium]|nr:hypothetical protein H0H92_016122 [Tricholoma furcatifolium]
MSEAHPSTVQARPLNEGSLSDDKHADEAVLKHPTESELRELTGTQFEDPNLDKEHLVLEDDSPYPEVRSAVANTDDPDMPVATVRSWVIGILWAVLIPGVNQFFFFRYPSVTVSGIVAQLLSFPLGKAAAAWVPNWSIFGLRLNPGPFSVKEHVMITISSLDTYVRTLAETLELTLINMETVQALSYFSWVTWIRPHDPSKAFFQLQLITVDLTSAEAIAALFGTSYDNQMNEYNVTRILTPENTIDLDAYHAYSPLFISTTFAISYGLSFASITATLVHTFIYFRKQIWVQARRALSEQPDIHARLMSRYPQVPEWWYLMVFLSMFALGVISIEVWPRHRNARVGLCLSPRYLVGDWLRFAWSPNRNDDVQDMGLHSIPFPANVSLHT